VDSGDPRLDCRDARDAGAPTLMGRAGLLLLSGVAADGPGQPWTAGVHAPAACLGPRRSGHCRHVLAAFLIAAPLLAFAARHWVYRSGLQAEQAQASAWHAVHAVLLADAPSPAPS
jgi:hypothetical protein